MDEGELDRAYQDTQDALAFVTAMYLPDDPQKEIAREHAVRVISEGAQSWGEGVERGARMATSMMIIIRRLITLRERETGATPEETLRSLGEFIHERYNR